MKIKKGDKVKVITGKYKGTVGTVSAAFPKTNKVIVEGVNIVKKAMKDPLRWIATNAGHVGSIIIVKVKNG